MKCYNPREEPNTVLNHKEGKNVCFNYRLQIQTDTSEVPIPGSSVSMSFLSAKPEDSPVPRMCVSLSLPAPAGMN